MATTTTPVKTAAQVLTAWQDIVATAQVISAAQDIAAKFAAAFSIRLARRSGSAFTAGWPNVRIEASALAAGNDSWVAVYSYQMQIGANIANTTLNGAIVAGAGTCTVAAATNIAVGDILFLGHTADVTKYELVRVKAVAGNVVTFEELCTFAHDNGAPVTDQAEAVFPAFDLSAYVRVRAVIDNAGNTQNIAAQIVMATFDSLSTV
jgi:hypothetical protein